MLSRSSCSAASTRSTAAADARMVSGRLEPGIGITPWGLSQHPGPGDLVGRGQRLKNSNLAGREIPVNLWRWALHASLVSWVIAGAGAANAGRKSVGESRVSGAALTSSLLDPLHHRPALRRAACIVALTTATLPAL